MGKNRPAIPKCRTREGSKEEGTGDEEIRLLELFNVDIEAGFPSWYFVSVSITPPSLAHPTFFCLLVFFLHLDFFTLNFWCLACQLFSTRTTNPNQTNKQTKKQNTKPQHFLATVRFV